MKYASYDLIETYLSLRLPFQGNSMSASTDPQGQYYEVYSYNTTIAVYTPMDNTLYLNTAHYSATTARHQRLVESRLARHHSGPVVECDGERALWLAATTLTAAGT